MVLDDTLGKGMVVKLKFRGWKLASVATVEVASKKIKQIIDRSNM